MKKIILFIRALTIIFLFQNNLLAQLNKSIGENETNVMSQLQFNGTGPNSYFGISVKNAGDVNGDSYEDIIIGAAYDGPGHAYIYYGGMNMNSVPDVIIDNQLVNDNLGFSVSGAGDVNADSYSDIIIGTLSGSKAFLFFGSNPMNNIPDITFSEPPGDLAFGYSVAKAGDVNGDSYDDFMISSGSTNNLRGRLYIYYGGPGLDNIPDVTLNGEAAYGFFGLWLSAPTGDVNGDGYDDILAGAHEFNLLNGKAYLFFGGVNMDTVADLTFTGNGGQSMFGFKTLGGDLNGDGFSDLIISEPRSSGTGRVYIYFGGASPDNNPDIILTGENPGDVFGSYISVAENLNQDGYKDIIVGAEGFNSNTGKVYVYFGGMNMDIIPDITFLGETGGSRFGYAVSTAEDVNGDGKSDILIGAQGYNSYTGRAYLYLYDSITNNPQYILTPNQNAINVNKSSDITVVFTQDMNASTINSNNIKVYGSQTGFKNCAISYNASQKKATINPNNDFKTGELISVTLKSGIKNLSGDSINSMSYSFTVEATQGEGIFSERIAIEDTIYNFAEGDLDNDGDIDILTLGIGNNIVINGNRGYHYKVYKNQGNNDFIKTSEFFIGFGYEFDFPWDVELADFDNDGDLDLLSQTEGLASTLYITLNNGDGTFQTHPNYSLQTEPIIRALIGDIDNDGDNDIIVNNIHLLNNGNATFQVQLLGFYYDPGALALGDFDNDGDRDILMQNRILFNNSNGTFTDTSSNLSNQYYEKAYVNDFDNDGDLDIIVSTSQYSLPKYTDLFLNIGNGTFSRTQIVDSSYFFVGSDFDADHDIDFIINRNGFQLYKNNGTGFFTRSQNLSNIQSIVNTGDFDNDGDIDLISKGEFINSGNIYGYRNAYIYLNSPSQQSCDPGTPHIEMLNYPGAPGFHNEARYVYQQEYPPYFPEDTVFADNHCGVNIMKPVDPCNPWVLEYYVAFFEDENDKVLVIDPQINWDTTVCLDFRYEYIYPPDYIGNRYYDSVVMKVTIIPHPDDACSVPSSPYICYNGDTIYNYDCWQTCLNDRITFRCIDSCEIPNITLCHVEYDYPLPVELISFVSIVENKNVKLKWTTATEENNSGFEVERSNVKRQTSNDWIMIGFVNGNGNSNTSQNYSYEDKNLSSGKYKYRLKQIDYNGNFRYYNLDNNVIIGIPEKFSLSQNYPNPFNPKTRIEFALPKDGNTMIKIFDMSGREMMTLINEFRTAGYYTIDLNASNLASGIYYYKLTSGDNSAIKKMVVIK